MKRVHGADGAVVSQHWRASRAGADILRNGGNAVDAAVATAFCLGVLEPWMSGLGGGGYLLVGSAGARPDALDFNLRTPGALRESDYPIVDGESEEVSPWPAVEDRRNTLGALAVCAPTMATGMELAWRRFGSMPWRELLEPAIGFAHEGLVLDWYSQLMLGALVKDLRNDAAMSAMYLDGNGDAAIMHWTADAERRIGLGALADTLDLIGREGARAVTEGDVGRALTDDVRRRGGVLEMADFEAAAPTAGPAERTTYRGNAVWTVPGIHAGGGVLSQILRALDRSGSLSSIDARFYRTLMETIIPPLRARHGAPDTFGTGRDGGSCTTHFCTADSAGLVVSGTITLGFMFGAKVLSENTGIVLNNGLSWFNPVPGQANSIGPLKRCSNNMSPTLVHMADGSTIAVGASGGRKIVPALAQLVSFMVDAGLTLEEALRQPRLDVQFDGTVTADHRLDEDALSEIRNCARLQVAPATVLPNYFAIAQILRESVGVVEAVADPHVPWAGGACASG